MTYQAGPFVTEWSNLKMRVNNVAIALIAESRTGSDPNLSTYTYYENEALYFSDMPAGIAWATPKNNKAVVFYDSYETIKPLGVGALPEFLSYAAQTPFRTPASLVREFETIVELFSPKRVHFTIDASSTEHGYWYPTVQYIKNLYPHINITSRSETARWERWLLWFSYMNTG